VLGRVVEGSSEKPLASVVVVLTSSNAAAGAPAAPGPGSASGQPRRAITDGTGRFLFHDLPAGRYGFSVIDVSGQVIGGFGMRRPGGNTQPLDLAAGQRAGDVILRAWRRGSVTGTLLDQNGEPIVDTRVRVLRAEVVAGRRRFRPGGSAMTDDLGRYRIARLEAGEYTVYVPYTQVTVPTSVQAEYDKVSAGGQTARSEFQRALPGVDMASLNGTGVRMGDVTLIRSSNVYGMDGPVGTAFTSPPPDEAGHLLVYPFTYLPNATSLSGATTFSLESGQERTGMDVQVRLVPAIRVSGLVVGPDGPASMVGVRLVPQGAVDAADEAAIEAAKTVTTASGEFTFLGVPSGQYLLKIARVPDTTRPIQTTQVAVGNVIMFSGAADASLPPLPLPDMPTLNATVAVSVSDRDVTNLAVSLSAGARMSGHLAYDGTAPRLTADQLVRATITLDPMDGRSFDGASGKGQFDAAGQFKTLGLLPGRYVLHVGGALEPWTLLSATVGGRDLADTGVTVESADLANVVITLTDHPSAISGTVRDGSGAPDATAAVLLFSTEREQWTDASAAPRRLRLARTSLAGGYQIAAVPPGDYFAIAIDDQFSDNWTDPKRLDRFARAAVRITVAPGDRHVLDLKTEAIR
jgi:hypothetical protein